ncbi:MAG TPA: hypothetical protein VFN61_08045 [Acidimicrobiales bacterium]|nr:hypothetical protein [Acidimicrobiales bacterium]
MSADERPGPWSQQPPGSGGGQPAGPYGPGSYGPSSYGPSSYGPSSQGPGGYGPRSGSGGARGWQDLPPTWGQQPPAGVPYGPGAGAQGTSDATGQPAWGTPGGYHQVPPAPLGDLLVAGSPRRARRKGRALGAVALAVVLIGGGAEASMVLAGSGGGGAATPEAAVQDLLSAVQNSDVIGVMDDLAPGERAALAPGVEDIFGQLKRIGVFSSGADLHDITGLSANFSGYKLSTQQLSPAVAAVTISGGTAAGTLDPNSIPLGSYFKSLAIAATTGQVQRGTSLDPGSGIIGTTQVDGKWYVSIGYTTALDWLQSLGKPLAPPAGALTPAGASTPQGAVQQLVSSMANMNLRSLIADLDPGELAALDAYAPLFIDQAQSAIDTVKSQVSITFTMPSMTIEPISSGTMVKFGNGFTLNVTEPKAGLVVNYSGGCLTVQAQGRTEHECASTSTKQAEQALLSSLPPAVQPILQRFISSPPDVGIVTSEVDGRWYVSPTRTYLQAVNAVLADLQPNDIQTVIANASGIGQGFEQYVQKEAAKQLGPSGLGLPSLPTSGLGTGLGQIPPSGAGGGASGAPSLTTAAAISNAMNAMTSEMAYYSANGRFSSDGTALDANLAWSSAPEPAHVSVTAGCETKPSVPSSFSAATACGPGKSQALLVRSESTQGKCLLIFVDEAGPSAQQRIWYAYRPTCAATFPAGAPLGGSAITHVSGWYSSF